MNTLSNLIELLESKNFHGKQKDLNGFHYINHLLRVNLYVNMFLNNLSKYDEQCADLNFRSKVSTVALLHDVLEDCDDWNKNKTYSQTNLEQFLKDYLLAKSQFNQQDVDDILATCQKLNKNNFSDKQRYLDNLLSTEGSAIINKMALLIKMADTLDNMNFFRMLQPNSKSLSKLNLTDMDDLPTIISDFKPFLSKLAGKLNGEIGNNNEYAVKTVKRLKNYLSNYELYRYHFIGNFLPEFAYQQHMVSDTIGHEVAIGTIGTVETTGYEVNEIETTLKEIATLYHGYMIAPTKINEINELARNAISDQSLLQKNQKNISYLPDYIEVRRLKKETKTKP